MREATYAVIPGRRRIKSLIEELQAQDHDAQDVNHLVASAIRAGDAFSYVRPGGTESEGLYSFLRYRFLRGKVASARPYSRFFRESVTPFSGVSYRGQSDLDYFCYRYAEAVMSSDLMGYGSFAPGALGIARLRAEIGLSVTPFEAMEPVRALVRHNQPWTLSLVGRKVLIVHPFAKTIEAQFQRKDRISGVKDVLPDLELSVMRAPISLKSGSSEFEAWPARFRRLVTATLEKDFDVALIGAGGYGAPLAHAIKSSGKPAIHTAGATQLIFGIRGQRWDTDADMLKVMDSSWVRPFPEDLSPEIRMIDGHGAYH